MKTVIERLIICVIVVCAVQITQAQYRIIGFAYDAAEDPFIAVEVRLNGPEARMVTQTDMEGRFEFHDIPRGEYSVVVITDYGIIEKKVNVRTSLEMHLQRSRNIRMDEITVTAVRTSEESPVPSVSLEREAIEKRNLGQDVPFILKWTPSVITTSDAGTGIGYTGMRVRGTDPTRINVTINGVPLNDAESQGVFWVDLPDLMTSTNSIQVQRGVGESTFGTGAFGASVNLTTTDARLSPYGAVSVSAGSFGTYRGSVQFGTGLLGSHFVIDGRLSTIQSDGYIDRATADLKSFYGSAAYIGPKTSVRFTSFGGKEITYQAWNGVPAQYVDDPELRTFNTAGTEKPGDPYANEVDDYTQTHYQLHVNQSIFTQLDGFLTMHYTRGKGFFEQYKAAPYDMFSEGQYAEFLAGYGLEEDDSVRRRWLDNHFYGLIAGLSFIDPTGKYDFRLSGGLNTYDGDHFGEVIWSASGAEVGDLPYYYFNQAKKKSGNIFGKLNYALSDQWSMGIDLQFRTVKYTFEGPDADGTLLDQEVKHQFFNPKFGLTFRPDDVFSVQLYGGLAQREPNRDDYTRSSSTSRPSPEKLYDNELVFRYVKPKIRVEAVGFLMLYDQQLVLTGRLNDVGEYTRVNVDRSYRLGAELNLQYQPVERLQFDFSATLSNNRIKEFTEYVDDWDSGEQIPVVRKDVPLSFSPSVLLMGRVSYKIINQARHDLNVGLDTKYVGEQYVDNTGLAESLLPAYAFADLQLDYTFRWKDQKALAFNVILRNVLDAKYSTNAWNYRFKSEGFDPVPDDPYAVSEGSGLYHLRGFFPQAGRNILAGLTFTF